MPTDPVTDLRERIVPGPAVAGSQGLSRLDQGRLVLGRLVLRRDYLRVAATRRRAAVPGLVLQVAPSELGPDAPPRIGYTASRKVGNAVRRNRARRRLKAAAALIMPVHAAPGRDYVVIAREATAELPWAALLEDFRKALGRLGAFTEAR